MWAAAPERRPYADLLAEKLSPMSDRLRTAGGVILVGWGVAVLLRATSG